VVAAKVDELAPDSYKIFPFGGNPGILIRTEDGEYRALSATCTHLDCTVQYRDDENVIWCACHDGKYSLDGKNISGPPPRPLEPYAVHVQGDEIVVEKTKA
jgi:Rieske Fe-S protein